jgi:predicted nucleic acid-binding protein
VADRFLDANVILRHLLGDHPEHSPRATAYIGRIERGEERVRTADTVVMEAVFTLDRSYRRPRELIQAGLLPILELPGVNLPDKRLYRRAFDFYVNLNISFADAYHAALMERAGIQGIASFDRHFDRVATVRRIEP